MLEFLLELDKNMFLFFNGLHSPAFDHIMLAVSGKLEWIPVYVVIIYFIIKKYKKGAIVVLLLVGVVITLSDQLSVKLFKEVFERLRPCHNPDIAGLVHKVNGKCGGKWGFVSSHSANFFALATYLHFVFKNRNASYALFFWAALVAYSRVYLGVHYPGDIIGGALLGVLCGFSVWKLYGALPAKWKMIGS